MFFGYFLNLSYKSSVMGITGITLQVAALLFSVTSNQTNYYSYRYNAVTVTNKKMSSVAIFQQTDD